jgi:enoyl-CoA hydratase
VAIGLADRLAEPGGAGPAALELARELAALSAPALLGIVRCIDAAQSMSFADGMEFERQELLELISDGEAHEGLRAFLDRRAPNFA